MSYQEGGDFVCDGSGQSFSCGGVVDPALFIQLQEITSSIATKLQLGDVALITSDGLIGRSTTFALTVVVTAINDLAKAFPAVWGPYAIDPRLVPAAGVGYEQAARLVASNADTLVALLSQIDDTFETLHDAERPIVARTIVKLQRTRPGLAFGVGLLASAVVIWLLVRGKRHREAIQPLHGTEIPARGKCRIKGHATMRDVKECASICKSHFFDRGSMRFFNSRVGEYAYADGDGGAYFVTSERMDMQHPRQFSVRHFDSQFGDEGCGIDTIEHMAYKTGAAATKAAKALAAKHPARKIHGT